MQLTDRYIEALDRISGRDLPEEALGYALLDEAALSAHRAPDDDIQID